MRGDERALGRVPRWALAGLAATLALQVGWRALQPAPTAHASELPAAPAATTLEAYALGEPVALAQITMLYLQAFDTQPGISIPLRDLDYSRVLGWLDRVLDLDPATRYPLLAATQVYAQVPDPAKVRTMLDFAYRRFLEDPQRRWPYLAHASIVARHRLGDLQLALRYAEAIAAHAEGTDIPGWARQMRIFLLEDMGEVERARILLGGLLASGTLKDPREVHFLTERLEAMKKHAGRISSSMTEN